MSQSVNDWSVADFYVKSMKECLQFSKIYSFFRITQVVIENPALDQRLQKSTQ